MIRKSTLKGLNIYEVNILVKIKNKQTDKNSQVLVASAFNLSTRKAEAG